MRLKYFMTMLFVVTFLSVSYVWQQAAVIRLAYEENKYNNVYKELLDRNKHLRYNLISLKSSSYLADKLLSEDAGFEIPKQSQILTLGLSKDKNIPSAAETEKSQAKTAFFARNGFMRAILKLQESWPIALARSYIDKQAQAQELINR